MIWTLPKIRNAKSDDATRAFCAEDATSADRIRARCVRSPHLDADEITRNLAHAASRRYASVQEHSCRR